MLSQTVKEGKNNLASLRVLTRFARNRFLVLVSRKTREDPLRR